MSAPKPVEPRMTTSLYLRRRPLGKPLGDLFHDGVIRVRVATNPEFHAIVDPPQATPVEVPTVRYRDDDGAFGFDDVGELGRVEGRDAKAADHLYNPSCSAPAMSHAASGGSGYQFAPCACRYTLSSGCGFGASMNPGSAAASPSIATS